MNNILKLVFFGYVMVKLGVTYSVDYMVVAVLLLVLASGIYREKFGSNRLLLAFEAVMICYGATLNIAFMPLLGLHVYDLISDGYPIGVIPVGVFGLYLFNMQNFIDFAFLAGLCSVFAYGRVALLKKEETYRNSYDKQREYSYQLEQAKAKLISSAEEIAHLAELRERNRIARQIHDNVGHSIAGILMQLQAAQKLSSRDQEKSSLLLENSIGALANTLTVMRDTVHNIKPSEKLGIEYIKEVVDSFHYCPVQFTASGDFGELPSNIIQILLNNIKESLTNISKYSKADKVEIRISINENFVRLYIKDNGVGSKHVKDGLGLSGMKERIWNIGGTISISGEDGFLIVCIIPLKNAGREQE